METHVHLSRSGSVDIFAASPPRRGTAAGGGTGTFEASFETTTPDNRRVRMTSDGTPMRDSTTGFGFLPAEFLQSTSAGVGNRARGGGRGGVPAARMPTEAGSSSSSSVTSSSKAVLSALRALQVGPAIHTVHGLCLASLPGS